MSEQSENIERVGNQIARFVKQFMDQRKGREFHADEMRRYVAANVDGYVAPGSPDRILRDLRQRRVVNYELVSRSQSLYRVVPVVEEKDVQQSLFV